MNTANNTKIVCRCSECGEAIIGDFNIFSLSGTPLRIKCPRCVESELTVELDRVSKVRLSVPCAFCRGTHKYTLSAPSFFSDSGASSNSMEPSSMPFLMHIQQPA